MSDVFSEIAIVWDDQALEADWQLTGEGNLLTAPALETAVQVSLFTDAKALPDDRLAPGETDRRGWWGNALDGEPIGSRLWLLRRAKREPATLRRAEGMIREALAWLIADGLAARIEVACEWAARSRMAARITVHRGDGGRMRLTAEWAWQGL